MPLDRCPACSPWAPGSCWVGCGGWCGCWRGGGVGALQGAFTPQEAGQCPLWGGHNRGLMQPWAATARSSGCSKPHILLSLPEGLGILCLLFCPGEPGKLGAGAVGESAGCIAPLQVRLSNPVPLALTWALITAHQRILGLTPHHLLASNHPTSLTPSTLLLLLGDFLFFLKIFISLAAPDLSCSTRNLRSALWCAGSFSSWHVGSLVVACGI